MGVVAGVKKAIQSLRPSGCTPGPSTLLRAELSPLIARKPRDEWAPEDLVITTVTARGVRTGLLAIPDLLIVPRNFGRTDEGHCTRLGPVRHKIVCRYKLLVS